MICRGSGATTGIPSGKGCRGRSFPTPPPSNPSPIIYSMNIYWVPLECQAQCLGTWNQRWTDKLLRFLEVHWDTRSVIRQLAVQCEMNCTSGIQNECFRSMGDEAIACVCPNRPWHLCPPGAGSVLQRLCLPPLSLGVQLSETLCSGKMAPSVHIYRVLTTC